jgi:hypothetical protein
METSMTTKNERKMSLIGLAPDLWSFVKQRESKFLK